MHLAKAHARGRCNLQAVAGVVAHGCANDERDRLGTLVEEQDLIQETRSPARRRVRFNNPRELNMKNLLATALSTVIAFGVVDVAFAAQPAMTQDQSAQPGTDGWITTKVKTELMTTKGIPSSDISVTTTNGIVTLSGVVDTKAEVQKSVAVAKAVKGVHRVDSSALSARHD